MKSTRLWMGSLMVIAVVGTVLASIIARPQPAALSATHENVQGTTARLPLAPELIGSAWLNTPDDKPITLASRRGKVTVVQFWTFGCANCQVNLPVYARWNKKFADKGVTIIGIHTPETAHERDPEIVARRVKDLGITYPILLDGNTENWKRWNQRYWPTVYLIDKAGRIRRHWEGELNGNRAGGEEKLTAEVERLLKETTPIETSTQTSTQARERRGKVTKIIKSEAEWKDILTPEQFNVLRKKGTERAFSGDYKSKEKGVYHCAACDLELFTSDTKFDSGTGWPSFWKPIEDHIETESDTAYGMTRTEVVCARCGGHLGHVFDDGPQPTGQRYCMNAVALKFEKQP